MMARARHPKKEIEAAIQHAEANGWRVTVGGSHAWASYIARITTPSVVAVNSASRVFGVHRRTQATIHDNSDAWLTTAQHGGDSRKPPMAKLIWSE